jgi:hypothetical protein
MWGTENSLAEINLESMGGDKGLLNFLGSIIGKHLQLCGRAHYCATRKNLEGRNPPSESEELESWGCSKILLSFLMLLDSHFLLNQQQQQCLPQLEMILDGHLIRHLPALFRLEIVNTTYKHLIGPEPHSHMSFAPVLVFLSQIDWL